MTDQQIAALANDLAAARRPNAPALATPKLVPESLEDAYRVQDAVLARLGPAAGWKVGGATPTAEPVCAPILSGGVMLAGPRPIGVPALVGVEIEIAVRLNRSFPAAATAPSRGAVLGAIGSAHIVIELCARRVADKSAAAPAMLLTADNIQNYGLVVGPEVANWQAIDGNTQVARMSADGKLLGETTGGHTAKDLAKLVVWQVGHCVTRRGGLAAGSVITTGAWTGMHMLDVTAACKISAEFPGLGRLDIVIAP